VTLAFLSCMAGCWGGAPVSLSATSAIDAVGAELRRALNEYHAEVNAADDAREDEAVAALIARLQRDANDAAATAAHVSAFRTAMAKLRADRRVESDRHAAALDNVRLLGEISAGVRRVAVESMTLSDEVKRYLTDLLEARQAAMQQPTDSGAPAQEQRP
jgi:hypothetical protein